MADCNRTKKHLNILGGNMSNETAKATNKSRDKQLSIFTSEGLEKYQARVKPFLSKAAITPQAFGRAFIFECNRNPKLKNCTHASIIKSFYFCAELALMPSFGQVWLIPRENGKNRVLECTVQIGVGGWITLLLRSPYVKNIIRSIVRENDKIDLTMGSTPELTHKVDINHSRLKPKV
jgi:recombinational DNA repair protein RecT